MRKLLCMILTLAMLLSAAAIVAQAADYSTRLPFSDTKQNAWYAEFVEYMYAEDLMFGKGNGKFQPQAGMTRAEMATLLSRIAGADVSGYAETAKQFSDIKGKRSFLYRGFEDITVKYAGNKSDYMYVPYTERYLQQFADLGAEGGSIFYHYDYDYDELEDKGVYRMGF